MKLVAIPAFSDNYIWMLHDGRQALVVDPGEAAPVTNALDAHGLQLTGILVTHHHGDHVGGVDALRSRLAGSVYGPAHEAIPEPCIPLEGGSTATLLGLSFQVIDVPGHTAGHIAYYLPDLDGAPLLFCGDTLFSAGCGRLFEGTAAQMHASLSRLSSLPGNTRICCAHEYTQSNVRFALAVEPGNRELAAYRAWCDARREDGLPTLPSSMSRELDVNPFLRCDAPAVIRAARSRGAADDQPTAIFTALRQWKNEFK